MAPPAQFYTSSGQAAGVYVPFGAPPVPALSPYQAAYQRYQAQAQNALGGIHDFRQAQPAAQPAAQPGARGRDDDDFDRSVRQRVN